MSENTGKNSPEAFGEATRTGLVVINNLALLSCTCVSLGLTLVGDLWPGTASRAAGWVAVLGWMLSVLLALFLAGRSQGEATVSKSIRRGLSMTRYHASFAALVVLLSAGAALSAWSRTKAEPGGVLASIVPALTQIQQDTSIIRAAVTREVTQAEQLSRLGFSMSTPDICRALSEGQTQAWQLMQQAGLPASPVSTSVGGGQHATCIEDALLSQTSRHGHWEEMLSKLPNTHRELDRLYLSQMLNGQQQGPLDVAALARAAGTRPPEYIVYTSASLLMYAVWGGNLDAVKGLLAAGADPSAGAKIEMMMAGAAQPHALTVTALAEAHRLKHADIVAALRARGASSSVQLAGSISAPPAKTKTDNNRTSSQPW